MLSKRWEMTWMLFSGITIAYMLRVNISVAAQRMRDDLDWNETEKGYVLSSFYWGYAFGQIPSALLIQIYGGKWVFGASILLSSILSLFVPLACESSFGLALFIRMCIGLSESMCFPSVFYFFPLWIPTEERTTMIPTTVAGMYLGEIIGFSLSGVLVDSEIKMGDFALGGWPSVFYFYGALGILWFPFWAFWAYESPQNHPTITKEELNLIQKGKSLCFIGSIVALIDVTVGKDLSLFTRHSKPVNHSIDKVDVHNADCEYNVLAQPVADSSHFNHSLDIDTATTDERQISVVSEGFAIAQLELPNKFELIKRIPWLAFVSHPVSITILVGGWTFGWIGFTLLSEMPSYLTDVLGFDLKLAGILCIFPYVGLFISSISFGNVFDYFHKQRGWSLRKVRLVSQIIAFLVASLCLIISGFLSEISYASLTFIILSQVAYGASQSGLGCSYTDVAPNYSSALNTLSNMIGAIAGISGPLVIADFIDRWPSVWGWRAAFFLTGAMAIFSISLWIVFFRPQIVPILNSPANKYSTVPTESDGLDEKPSDNLLKLEVQN